jgi:hypothetical protein
MASRLAKLIATGLLLGVVAGCSLAYWLVGFTSAMQIRKTIFFALIFSAVLGPIFALLASLFILAEPRENRR